jgi:TrmH family RNA methyltransferase
LVLILGNEISGIDPGILEIADHTLYIPMSGKKTSLNVAVSAGIALYTLQNSWKIQQKTIIEKD